jgi:hypothetical protein
MVLFLLWIWKEHGFDGGTLGAIVLALMIVGVVVFIVLMPWAKDDQITLMDDRRRSSFMDANDEASYQQYQELKKEWKKRQK